MQVHLSKQNSITTTRNRNLSSTSILMGIFVITVTLSAMVLIPGYWSFGTGVLVICLTLKYLIASVNRKPLLLEITDDKISYLSEERNELVTIRPEEIRSIAHKFCELQIHTKDNRVYNINLLNTGSEQTRWEIKEHTRMLIERIQHN
ncbi:MAG: hypothetical protein H7Y13_06495 [Sphingobacteriaceae bacterium]|nr:hypothetical protein [Sphingobacteriaceae bacterium]